MPTAIQIQQEDFCHAEHYQALARGSEAGAVVTFTGRVREFTSGTEQTMYLEHYPAMTAKVLENIVERARSHWPLLDVRIVHRIGQLHPGDQIVFVGVSSAHREAAFKACQFIMDFLKTEAPFWKKEGEHWVEAKNSDFDAASTWIEPDDHEPAAD